MTQPSKRRERAISNRLQKAKRPEALAEVVASWIANWEKEQSDLIDRLGAAVAQDDFDAQSICVGELREVTKKRFTGLRNVAKEMLRRINDLSNPGRD